MSTAKVLANVPDSSSQSSLLGLTDGQVTKQSVDSFLKKMDLYGLPNGQEYNLDNFTESGMYFFHVTNTENDPLQIGSGYILLVFSHSSNYVVQIAIYGMWRTGMYIRKKANGTWGSWTPFTNDPMPT